MQNSFPLGAIIRRIGSDGIAKRHRHAKSSDNFLKFAMASVQMDFGTTDPDGHRPRVFVPVVA